MKIVLAGKIGKTIKKAASERRGWYDPHMAAATRAIAQRIPLVDLVLEVRDARIPVSSEYELLRNYPSSRRVIVLNKLDLASRSRTKEWIRYFDQRNYISHAVNSHNKDSVKEFLNFLQAQIRELKRAGHSSHTTTIMLLGIPNAGKSALANSLHQIGRISAAERGKLRHATVSPQPGETKDISSLKIGSHPNIYVLDTPGILPPQINDFEVCSKLALTGAIRDCVVREKELAQYFLFVVNQNDEYRKWAKLSTSENDKLLLDHIVALENDKLLLDHKVKNSSDPALEMKQKKQYITDHTQDFIVHDVRRILFNSISCFQGDLENEKDLVKLTETQLLALREAFQVFEEGEDAHRKIAAKLLNLYRTGRLGHYTLDDVPTNST